MTSTTPTFSAQLLGQTEKAANAILDRLLARPGLTEPQWVTLSLAVASGDTVEPDEFVNLVSGALKIGEAGARTLLADLADAHFVDVPDDGHAPVKATDAGQQLYRQIRAQVSRITDRLWGDLPEEDLATAGRVLSTVLQRANAELSAGRSGS
jgi:DNA-binding MarR family transcriptional regulator